MENTTFILIIFAWFLAEGSANDYSLYDCYVLEKIASRDALEKTLTELARLLRRIKNFPRQVADYTKKILEKKLLQTTASRALCDAYLPFIDQFVERIVENKCSEIGNMFDSLKEALIIPILSSTMNFEKARYKADALQSCLVGSKPLSKFFYSSNYQTNLIYGYTITCVAYNKLVSNVETFLKVSPKMPTCNLQPLNSFKYCNTLDERFKYTRRTFRWKRIISNCFYKKLTENATFVFMPNLHKYRSSRGLEGLRKAMGLETQLKYLASIFESIDVENFNVSFALKAFCLTFDPSLVKLELWNKKLSRLLLAQSLHKDERMVDLENIMFRLQKDLERFFDIVNAPKEETLTRIRESCAICQLKTEEMLNDLVDSKTLESRKKTKGEEMQLDDATATDSKEVENDATANEDDKISSSEFSHNEDGTRIDLRDNKETSNNETPKCMSNRSRCNSNPEETVLDDVTELKRTSTEKNVTQFHRTLISSSALLCRIFWTWPTLIILNFLLSTF